MPPLRGALLSATWGRLMARPPAQRHTIKFDLPEDFLATMGGEVLHDGIPKARIAGAVAAGVGAFVLVRTFQKFGGDVLREVAGVFVWIGQALTGRFDPPVSGFGGTGEEIFAPEPFAISMGLVVGGMILAGQNPGEVLKGIGEIIPG